MSQPNEAIDYDYWRQDVYLTHRSFLPSLQDTIVRLPRGTFLSNIPSDDLKNSIVAEAITQQDRTEGQVDQRIHYAVVNPDANSPDITLVNLHWTGDFKGAEGLDHAVELASVNPDRRFLFYDTLGFGQSDSMPKPALKEIERTGRFDAYAELVLNGLARVIGDFDNIDLIGLSQGGMVAAEMAIQMQRVGSLITFDTPATLMPVKDGVLAFMYKERKHTILYDKNAPRISGAEKPNGVSPMEVARMVLNKLLKHELVSAFYEPIGLVSRSSYAEVLAEALPNVQNRFVFLSPDHSELNEPNHVSSIIKEAISTSKPSPAVVDQVIFNGTHAFGFGNRRALPVLETYALTHQHN